MMMMMMMMIANDLMAKMHEEQLGHPQQPETGHPQ